MMDSSLVNERPPTWNDKRRGKPPNYKYKKMEEIYDEETFQSSMCNIYGIVSDFKEPAKSKGSDYYGLVFVVDDTSQKPIRVRLFYGDPAFFPKVGVGDIIRLHRLKVSRHRDQVTLISTKGWSWVLWDAADPYKQEESSSSSYTLLKSDKDRVERLREWQKQYSDDYFGDNNNFKRLSEVTVGEHFCLLCKVIAFEQPSTSQITTKIWDGTKPVIDFNRFEPTEYEHKATDIPFEYVVDVAIYSNHVDKWHELGIMEGNYIVFRGLHAWPNPANGLNSASNVCCELSLHSGTVRGRSVEKAPDDDLLYAVKLDISAVRRETMGDMNDVELIEEDASTSFCPDRDGRRNSTPPLDGTDNDALVPSSGGDKMQFSNEVGGVGLDPTTGDQLDDHEGTPRCLQDSLTIVTGEGMPTNLSSLQNVMGSDVPLNTSKLFLTRVQLKSCETPEEEYVGHFSPVTTIFYPTRNEGEPLCMSEDARMFIETWRKVRGLDQEQNSAPAGDSQPFSQWELPSPDGQTHALNMKKYKCEKDGSEWESIETEDHIVRKRKHGDTRFTVLYVLDDSECTPESLKKYTSKYDRVIRVLPLALLTSQNPPPVGIQDDVFYYCCPANAVHPVIPSLQEEAERFIPDRITSASGSPVLLPFYNIVFGLHDESGSLEYVHLSGESAVHFFCDTSPQDVLLDRDDVCRQVREGINILIRDGSMFDCIVEKKSRLALETKTPTYIYSVRNTALRLSDNSNVEV